MQARSAGRRSLAHRVVSSAQQGRARTHDTGAQEEMLTSSGSASLADECAYIIAAVRAWPSLRTIDLRGNPLCEGLQVANQEEDSSWGRNARGQGTAEGIGELKI